MLPKDNGIKGDFYDRLTGQLTAGNRFWNMKKVSQYSLCKHDIYLAAALAAVAALLLVLFLILRGNGEGNIVIVTVQGEVYGTYRLDEEQEIRIETELGQNLLHIANGTVSMEDADCPDGYCISQGGISHNKDTIVCLPHRLVAEIRYLGAESQAPEDDEVDAISQ